MGERKNRIEVHYDDVGSGEIGNPSAKLACGLSELLWRWNGARWTSHVRDNSQSGWRVS